ncbi:putative dihydroxyacetone kinase (DakA) [Aspergillus mulundensis]|uniref:Dihydroxyacetone kinase n=1 Tax=Aspergillus mulundensis TaxID=1810919 RepID=A0A3D8QMM0_9EURO|nr:Dihydroxyacetone kinase [Aspergillus mulundensis]RDW63039.1 Dihydroxyacetone kinase [Aspergillus mulundensis]
MAQTKHFFSDPTHLVHTALNSLTLTNPSLAFDLENKIIFRRPDVVKKGKVAIISGGGSGHEPAFAGFVGQGLLDASAAGTIFASPNAEQIRIAAMERVNNEQGVLIIPMNYTGDVLNFGMAAEKSRAAGIKTEFFAINDDAGVGKLKGGKVGRRGIGGGVLILKIVGALAEAGGSLEDVYKIAQLANENLASVGSSLEHVHVPGREVSDDHIPEGEVEIGMGIHNEPGSHRAKATLVEMVSTMLLHILDHNDPDRAYITRSPGDKFVLLINNLGGVSTIELSGITDEVYRQLDKSYQIKPERVIQGTFLTSLNGLGFSISLLKLADTGLGPGKSFLELLDAPAEAVGWSAPVNPATWEYRNAPGIDVKRAKPTQQPPSNIKLDIGKIRTVLGAALQRVIDAEPLITRYDTIVGDGDCGIGLKRGAEAVLDLLNDSANLNDDVISTVNSIVNVVENTMDGTSGAIYAIFLNALVHGLREQDKGSETPADVDVWGTALKYSIAALGKYTPAQIGDRTLIDALVPFAQTLAEKKDVHAAAEAAHEGTEATKHMKASLGRAVYVGGEEEWVGKVPDPGAFGLSAFFAGLADAL